MDILIFTLIPNSFTGLLGHGCSTAVEHTPHNQEDVGLTPAACWLSSVFLFFFPLLPSTSQHDILGHYLRTAKKRTSCRLLLASMAFSVEETNSGAQCTAHLPRTPSHCEKDPEMKSTSQDAEMFI